VLIDTGGDGITDDSNIDKFLYHILKLRKKMKIVTLFIMSLWLFSTTLMADIKYLTNEKISELSKSSKFLSFSFS